MQTCVGRVLAPISSSSYEPCLVNPECRVLVSIPLALTLFLPPLPKSSLSTEVRDLMKTLHLDSLST